MRYLPEVNSSISRDSPAAVQSHRDLLSVQFEQLQLQVVDTVRLASQFISQNALPYGLLGLLDYLPMGILDFFGLHSIAVFTMTCVDLNPAFSLVERFMPLVMLRQLSYAIKNQLGHPKLPTRDFEGGILLAPPL